MRSNLMKKGLEKYPHRSLLKAMGLTDREIDQPFIGIANSFNELLPGHIHLDKITQAAKAGVRMAGGTPLEFGVIGVCDGLAMHHQGMKYSLPSRELIAASIEIMATAHPVAGLILAGTVGTVMALLAGYFGGKLDIVIMRTVDVLLALPMIILALLATWKALGFSLGLEALQQRMTRVDLKYRLRRRHLLSRFLQQPS